MSEHLTAPQRFIIGKSEYRADYNERLQTKSREELEEMLVTETAKSTRAGPYSDDYTDADAVDNVNDIERALAEIKSAEESSVYLLPKHVRKS